MAVAMLALPRLGNPQIPWKRGAETGHHDAGKNIRGKVLWLLPCAATALVTPGSGLSLPLCFQYYLQHRPHLFHFESYHFLFGLATVCVS